MPQKSIRQALNEALGQEMRRAPMIAVDRRGVAVSYQFYPGPVAGGCGQTSVARQ